MQSPRLRVLIVSFTETAREPRALKQIPRLSEEYEVTTAGFGPTGVPGIPHIELDPQPRRKGLLRFPGAYPAILALRQYRYLSRNQPRTIDAYGRLSKEDPWDIIIAHDVLTIALANRLQARLGVLSDLHEYAPRQNEHSFLWRWLIAPYFRWLLTHEVRQASEVTTVSQGIVDEYRRVFGIEAKLVNNATEFRVANPHSTESPIRLVHSGIPGRQRKLDMMIEGVKASSADVTLDLYLMPTDPEHLEELKICAAGDPRITFREPVAYDELLDTLANYDIGISLIPPTTFNLKWCLPNKFFDFIQARLGVIIGPSPEMLRFVEEHHIGAVTSDFTAEALTVVLDSLDPIQIDKWKRASHDAASNVTAEAAAEGWIEAVNRIAQRATSA